MVGVLERVINSPRFHILWAINAPLDQPRLRRQVEEFCAAGFDGIVWHPRFYPGEPPYLGERYLAELSETILCAKALGLAFWIYDEDGWPSGTVGGQLLRKYPADAQRWAELVTERPSRCLAEFERSGKHWYLAERTGSGVDYLNPELARHFIGLTHERYRAGLKPEAWSHVEAIFCDEPEFGLGHAHDALLPQGAIPWTPALPELFRQRYGEDLLAQVPELFFPGAAAAVARVKFWELLTDLFNESFTQPINDWCARNGKLFTAHLKGEEHPLFQVPTSGSCHKFFRNLSLPGIDALERYPGNNFYPRQVSSAARQFGTGRCMVEAFGGAGWGATPEDLERYLLWLGRHGLTDFVLHLSQYRLDSAAIQDWPPSQPLHLTWREAYPEVLRRVRRELEDAPRRPADTLVVAPTRGIMASYEPWEFLQTNIHNASTYPATTAGSINRRFLEGVEALHAGGVNYDVADERTVEQYARRSGAAIALGSCRYRRVMVEAGCQLSETARALVQGLDGGREDTPSAPVEIGSGRAASNFSATLRVEWSLAGHPKNLLLLEVMTDKDGWHTAKFTSRLPLPAAGLELVFADDISEASFNDKALALRESGEGSLAGIGSKLLQGMNLLRFRTSRPNVEGPFVWARGLFRVVSASPYVAGPAGTLKTGGPLVLHPADATIQDDLIAAGFPFLRETVAFAGAIELSRPSSALRLNGVEADALRLAVDGRDLGWNWRMKGELHFQVALSPGTHRLRLELVPNAFNAFGPHHYYGGDWHIVSPGQMRGVRNFADPADAPAATHVAAWHFRRFCLPATLSFL